MLKLAWRNLVHERIRLAISVGGVALAVLLILIMGGIFAGSEEHAVLYIRRQPAPLWLMQEGVENLHMSASMLPAGTVERVKDVEGVGDAVGVLYLDGSIEIEGNTVYSYLFGIEPDAPFGGPWSLVEGTDDLGLSEIVIDRDLARRYGLDLGDEVKLNGYEMTIAGLSEDTFGIATSVAFINKTSMAFAMGVSPQAASYILIQLDPDADLDGLSRNIREAVPDSTLLTQDEFAESDQEMIRQMGADVIRIMNYVAYVIGMMVVAITIYTATLEKAREYGVLKALGANARHLLSIVFAQAFLAATLGFVAGVALSYGAAALISEVMPEMLILVLPQTWLSEIPKLALITALAALMPISSVLRADPMMVFKA